MFTPVYKWCGEASCMLTILLLVRKLFFFLTSKKLTTTTELKQVVPNNLVEMMFAKLMLTSFGSGVMLLTVLTFSMVMEG